MFEKSTVANRYSLVEDGDISSSTIWVQNGTSHSNDGVALFAGTNHPTELNNNVYRLVGDVAQEKTVTQTILTQGSIGDRFVFGGWMQADTIPEVTYNSVTYGQRMLKLAFMNGTTEVNLTVVSFNSDSTDWQYASASAIAEGNYTSIAISFIYGRNCNAAYFDGIQLYKDEFAKSFYYTASGNLASIIDLLDRKADFEYDMNDNLTKSVDSMDNETNYTYDNKHNLLTATSAEGLVATNTYNSNGQITETKTGTSTNYIRARQEYFSDTGFIKKVVDAREKSSSFTHNSRGQLTSTTDPKGTVNTKTYETSGLYRLLSDSIRFNSNTTASASYGYNTTTGLLETIMRNSTTYGFEYDAFGRRTKTKVGSTALSTTAFLLGQI